MNVILTSKEVKAAKYNMKTLNANILWGVAFCHLPVVLPVNWWMLLFV
jgi:hypothetical protein